MKKIMTIGLVAMLVAGVVNAQQGVVIVDQTPASNVSGPTVSAEVALVSAHVWRGQVLNNDFVAQSQVTVSKNGVSLNVWGNYDFVGNNNGIDRDFSEIDISLAYSLPMDINEIAIDIGVISYNFPANGAVDSQKGVNKESTTEVFVKATALSWKDYFIPSITFFGDADKVEGNYILFDVVAPYQVSDYLAVEGGLSAGWGNTSYNDYYWGGAKDADWNDYNLYANASYEVLDNLTASLNLTYTMLDGGSIRDAAGGIYESKQKFWGGVNMAYDF